MQIFHLAIPVNDLDVTRKFYEDILNLPTGRENDNWVDFNFFGHQLVLHLAPKNSEFSINKVDEKEVRVPHFGVILDWKNWHELAERLKSLNVEFIIEPHIRFRGNTGEQATMFFLDPSNNALEFKAFKDISQLFAK